MLKMTFTKRPVQEIAPWMTMVTPELVLDKDGSLLTVFEFEGIDADTPNPGDITRRARQPRSRVPELRSPRHGVVAGLAPTGEGRHRWRVCRRPQTRV